VVDLTKSGDGAAAPVPMPLGADGKPLTKGYIRYAMWVLLIVYIFNFLDRQIVNILAADIKSELKINDTQFGLLSGTAFAFLYTFAGIPIARLAEKKNRVTIMSVSLAVWSGFTALCGSATTFMQFFLARIGVGIGEAGGSPPAHSLISDYFPKEKRASALSFYQMGVPLGTLIGLVFGGFIADVYNWRVAFWVAGVPGVLLAVVCFFTLKETRQKAVKGQAISAAKAAENKVSFWVVLKLLTLEKKTFPLLSLAAATKTFISYGTAAFLPLFYFTNHPEAVNQAASSLGMGDRTFVGLIIGIITGVFGSASALFGGWIADKTGRKDVRDTMWAPALANLLTVPAFAAAVLVENFYLSLALVCIPYALNYIWSGPVYGTTQSIVPPHMRATAAAMLLFVINMIGLGLGPLLIGVISDTVASGQLAPDGLDVNSCKALAKAAPAVCAEASAHGLKMALAIGPMFGLIGVVLFLAVRKTITKDVVS